MPAKRAAALLATLPVEMNHARPFPYRFDRPPRRSQRAGPAAGVLRGGLSGVAWTQAVASAARLVHACKPVSPALAVTAAQGSLVTGLDGQPALTVLLRALGIAPADATAPGLAAEEPVGTIKRPNRWLAREVGKGAESEVANMAVPFLMAQLLSNA